MKKLLKFFSASGVWVAGLGVFYFLTHLIGLTKLPVFADEAIYIRWAQLIMDDSSRYALFALNDGKTPLFIWSLIPWQYVFSDQLWAGRWLAVLVGAGQILIFARLLKEFGLSKKWQLGGSLLMSILPFWFFHHRMALMDGMLVMWLTLSWLGLLRAIKTRHWSWTLLTGVSFGLALLTKLPAILFAPVLALAAIQPFLTATKSTEKLKFSLEKFVFLILQAGLAGAIGFGLFLLLKFSPAFGQLFSRGGDFLFRFSELSFSQVGKNLWNNGRVFLTVFGTYLTWPSLGLIFAALFVPKQRRTLMLLILMTLSFILPIQIMGKVIYARYLLPAALPLTVALVLSLEALISAVTTETTKPKWLLRSIKSLLIALFLGSIITTSIRFMIYSWLNPNYLPLTVSDQVQYLTEWSAGNGVVEVSQAALKVAEKTLF